MTDSPMTPADAPLTKAARDAMLWLAQAFPGAAKEDVCRVVGQALDEADALRVKLAEVTRERDIAVYDVGVTAALGEGHIVALQAALAEARELLRDLQRVAAPERHGGVSVYPYEHIGMFLDRPAGSNDALRAVVADAAHRAWSSGYGAPNMAKMDADIAAIVARILGTSDRSDPQGVEKGGQG